MAESLSPRVPLRRKGLSRAEITVRKVVKGRAEVYGKGKHANTLLGWLIPDVEAKVWRYQIKGRDRLSVPAFGTKRLAAVAMGEKL